MAGRLFFSRSYSSVAAGIGKKKIVVVGGGAGGSTVASSLAAKYDVTLVEPAEYHYYQPLWTLVGGGIKDVSQSRKRMGDVVGKGVHWTRERVNEFRPEENAVVTEEGTKHSYDALVVAVGLNVNWGGIKGLPEALSLGTNVSSNYSYDYAPQTYKLLQATKEGTALFTVPATPIKCGGAPQKIMYLADDLWTRNGVRNQIDIQFTSAIGKLFPSPYYAEPLHKVAESKNCTINFGMELVEINNEANEAVYKMNKDISGSEGEKVIKFSFMHVTPPMGPHGFVKESPLSDAAGWVDINKSTMQHNKFPNVFGLGDCTNAPTSKTAAAAFSESVVLKSNLESFLSGTALTKSYHGYTSCPLTVGGNKLILAEFDYELKPNETFPGIDQRKPSQFSYFLKASVMPSLYWKTVHSGFWLPSLFKK